MNKPEFMSMFGTLAATYRAEFDELAVEGYWLALGDLDPLLFRASVLKAMKTCQFMPAPAELLEFAGKGDDTERKGAEAWAAVRAAVRKHDSYASVDFGTLVNHVVRNMGGWVRLCDMTKDEVTWKRKEFERLYALFCRQPDANLDGRPLLGEHDAPPIRIQIGPITTPVRQLLPEAVNPNGVTVGRLINGLAKDKSA